jgi:hypothetical protein
MKCLITRNHLIHFKPKTFKAYKLILKIKKYNLHIYNKNMTKAKKTQGDEGNAK